MSCDSRRLGMQPFRQANPPPSSTLPASLGFRRAPLYLLVSPLFRPGAYAQALLAGGSPKVGGLALALWGPPRFSKREGRGAGGGGRARLPPGAGTRSRPCGGARVGAGGLLGPSGGWEDGMDGHLVLVSAFIIFNHSSPATITLYGP